jgi:hypothetical protein
VKLDERITGAPPTVTKWMQLAARKVNDLAAGLFSAREGQLTAAPTTGTHAQGDIVWKSAPVEAGAGGSKYVILGWVCTVSGTPGTWLEMRVLTGN